ncbi:DNA polymerase III subunit beta [Sulfobacillus thermosulfidooxidans]|uniref:Beta sliding clamp n=2 Tax=Sulfobacillus thermosulfidooxidans TaxID=28034 RepID=A0A1W1WB90_SULTA|nr:DNA polymerase III subunit beta [Sulfobacillus thermosulfidooxidans]OLZ08982.1 DNA polymerase III subunit beta [Sulfobacillus thermosulfidooxidans]OLZ14168.1 DNA polymerase III subunit beta [Sulfobacillus thermosulfidooxidans]OLZ18911.1 DNA polymerase III subunit beta [Sulfobacillus thermosulfidooxidans]PSR27945.1 MAG: DNA polymerase III subunit beta [Sulfobacillus thermosulfidooxidans]SMC03571.1 DNA polymerase-3 subunit beta [Sulfobacillus thermosulfidooxidans DSM 9293]
MRFSAAQDQTASALQQVIRVIQPQNTMAILTGVQLQADRGVLRLSATDLSSHIVAEIPCDVSEPGYVVLPASTLSDLIHRLPTATFELSTEESSGRATIRYGRNKAVINGFGREMLPNFPAMNTDKQTIELPAGTLATLSRQLLFACSKDDTRPILKGVYIKLANGRLVMVATDGSRLSHTWLPVPDYRGIEESVVISPKVLAEGARINANQAVTLTMGQGLIELSAPGMTFTSRLLDGQYPDYDRVIPTEYISQCRAATGDFRGAVERVSLIAAKERSTPLRIRIESGSIELSTQAAEIGQAEEIIDCPTEGQNLDILFNPTYILEAIKSLDGEEVIIEFSGVQSPAKIRSADNSSYFHILLPLRQLV